MLEIVPRKLTEALCAFRICFFSFRADKTTPNSGGPPGFDSGGEGTFALRSVHLVSNMEACDVRNIFTSDLVFGTGQTSSFSTNRHVFSAKVRFSLLISISNIPELCLPRPSLRVTILGHLVRLALFWVLVRLRFPLTEPVRTIDSTTISCLWSACLSHC